MALVNLRVGQLNLQGSAGMPIPEKRGLTSPEDEQQRQRPKKAETLRRVPFAAGLSTPAPSTPAPSSSAPSATSAALASASICDTELCKLSPEEMYERVHQPIKNMLSVCTGTGSNKLNKAEVNTINSYGQDVLAIAGLMDLPTLQHQAAQIELLKSAPREAVGAASGASATATKPSFSDMVRSRNVQMPIPAPRGPVLAVYPAEANDKLKTAEDTKAELKRAVNPVSIQVQVDGLRKVGNAGVVIQTTSQESARRFREAIPPTLRVTEPKQRTLLVAVGTISGDPDPKEMLATLHEQNLREDSCWPLERLQKEAKVAFKKSRRGSGTTTVVLECLMLIDKGRIYYDWDVAAVHDFVSVTCCNKCQLYGHPEKYCRAAEVVSGKCGGSGHKSAECSAKEQRCATCYKFGKKDAATHTTGARQCSARIYAEERRTPRAVSGARTRRCSGTRAVLAVRAHPPARHVVDGGRLRPQPRGDAGGPPPPVHGPLHSVPYWGHRHLSGVGVLQVRRLIIAASAIWTPSFKF
ncbi:hypothetical protein ABMA27_011220 [Loxostege sticticalis]|uniref:Gag-like protein n=1 Tax=Loxostege sticticalis TaxID=481309 RepID=A0ABR3H1V6_LOXSC